MRQSRPSIKAYLSRAELEAWKLFCVQARGAAAMLSSEPCAGSCQPVSAQLGKEGRVGTCREH